MSTLRSVLGTLVASLITTIACGSNSHAPPLGCHLTEGGVNSTNTTSGCPSPAVNIPIVPNPGVGGAGALGGAPGLGSGGASSGIGGAGVGAGGMIGGAGAANPGAGGLGLGAGGLGLGAGGLDFGVAGANQGLAGTGI
jgi:hypothetical protein